MAISWICKVMELTLLANGLHGSVAVQGHPAHCVPNGEVGCAWVAYGLQDAVLGKDRPSICLSTGGVHMTQKRPIGKVHG